MNLIKWTVWTGLRADDGCWLWKKVASRKWSKAARAVARKLAREHRIMLDLADGRAVAFGHGDYEPSSSTLVCNRNGSFFPLGDVWP